MSQHPDFEGLTPEEIIATDGHQYIAFILDGTVQYILGTDILFSAILQSEPIIKDITGRADRVIISAGDKYDEDTDTYIKDDLMF